jgi:ectoine hydroxylase-related dioxygenase (phytanoyl-CoA dioxygenase family)
VNPEPDLPPLESEYPLAPDRIAAFQRDGHVLLRGVCTPEEAAAYRPAIRDATYRYSHETRPLEERDTYGKAFIQTGGLFWRDEAIRRFVFARRFAQIAARLMGVEAVRLYHDQALFKEAGGGHTPWHQDQYYWPLDTDTTVTMWMPLVDLSEEMGTMVFATGSAKAGLLGHLSLSDESESEFQRYVEEKGLPQAAAGAMRAGDATFHAGLTLHRAPGNEGDYTREVMTVIYYPDGVRLLEPDNPGREGDMRAIFPEGRAGGPAVSALTPLLYPVYEAPPGPDPMI